ncbi:hypothetical protein PV04_07412 [Phialophora macrospora]|uniref:AAA+ ATPase lid domain-containing protein n=1 Tax=Phialophora macrospora TaxID=1851006 RepID=A0A0D2FZ21_9EURO|nr:hypothetical protein PV04_07412 [Phialophora macrospora]
MADDTKDLILALLENQLEAKKSTDLNKPQRRRVWRNFINRLKALGEDIDSEDLEDNLPMLGKEELNGRQIRNAITTARQGSWPSTKGGRCYTKDLKGGQTDEERKKLEELR